MTLKAKFDLALQHQRLARYSQAEAAYREIVAALPAAEVFNNLALVLEAQGKTAEALGEYSKAVATRPDYAQGYVNLGRLLLGEKRYVEATGALTRAVELCPDHADAHNALGNAALGLEDPQGATTCFRRAIAANPGFVDPHNNLGIALERLNRPAEAIAEYRHALSLDQDFAAAAHNLAGLLLLEHEPDEAIELYRRVLHQNPDLASAWGNLGTALKEVGDLEGAIQTYRKSLAITPDAPTASNLLYAMYFHGGFDAGAIRVEHERFDAEYCAPLAQGIPPHVVDRDPAPRLRIGYVSPDFRVHCQAHFTLPLLLNHDRKAVEIFCYSSVPAPDAMTDRIRGLADTWRDISKLDDGQAAALVREDRIDILVDLTMHMDRNRLLIFARKPAPVQVSWLAYPGTTGLRTMDYRLSDPYLDPLGGRDDVYTETTVRLPDAFWCYDPLADGPAVNELPATANGHVTFGCLNNPSKITPLTLDLWAAAMHRVAGSKLIVLAPRGGARENLLRGMVSRGIDAERVSPLDRMPRPQYLGAYNRFDLCLDTFPYTGHTTTLDGLWMGVPPVTMWGETAVSRGGLSLLSNMGLQRLAATTPQRWVDVVSDVTDDLPALAQLRKTLRPRLVSSPLMDGPRFAKGIERAFASMWQNWCAGGHTASPS